MKRVPKMIRGITMAMIMALSNAGGVVYQQISKIFYQTSPGMVYLLIAMFDVLVLFMILVAILFEKWGDMPKNMEVDEDKDSKENEGAETYMDIDDGFKDDFAEVPFGKELHDEEIPEVDSNHEYSKYSRQNSKFDVRKPSIDIV